MALIEANKENHITRGVNGTQLFEKVHTTMSLFWINGRLGRLRYFLTALVASIIFNMANYIVVCWIGGEMYIYIVCMLLMIISLWIGICAGVKRCHDLGHNGRWQFIPFYCLWMLFCESEHEDNEYSPPL